MAFVVLGGVLSRKAWDDFAGFSSDRITAGDGVQEGLNCPITDVLNDSQIV